MTMTKEFPTLLIPEEVMNTLHVDEQTLDAMITSGQLPAYDFSEEGYRFFPSDVQALSTHSVDEVA